MDILSLVVTILIIWFIARLCGRVFDGPRYRRRRARKDYRRAQERIRYDAHQMYQERRFMHNERRRW